MQAVASITSSWLHMICQGECMHRHQSQAPICCILLSTLLLPSFNGFALQGLCCCCRCCQSDMMGCRAAASGSVTHQHKAKTKT